jgi:hypothetical protein
MAGDIFEKQGALRPSQLAAVADRRFGDAQALCDTGQNARANGAQYLAGIVLDILLKAQLMREHEVIARKRASNVSEADRPVWSLIWRSHDMEEMLGRLPQLTAAIRKRGERDGKDYFGWLHGICCTWTVYARYSSLTTTIQEAQEMLNRVRELKELLK